MTRSRRLPGVLFALLGLIGNAQSASAQNFSWNLDASGSWNTAGNWSPATVPNAQGVTVLFGNVITANQTVSLDSDVTVGSIAFENTPFSYTIGGSATITLDNGVNPASISVASNVTAGQTISRQLIALSDINITNGSITSLLDLSGGMTLGGNTIAVSGPGTVNFGGAITGSTGSRLVLNGPGAVSLSASAIGLKHEVNGGTLIANAGLALQPVTPNVVTSDLITLTNGGTVNFRVQQSLSNFIGITLGTGGGRIISDAAGTIVLSGPITGSGSLTKAGPQTIALAASSNYTGETFIREGALRIDVNALNGLNGALGMATSPVILGDNAGANSTALFIGVSGVTIGRDITVVSSPTPGASTVTIGSILTSGFDPVHGAFTGTLTLNRSVIIETRGNVSFGRITGTGDFAIEGSGNAILTSSASDFAGTISLNGGTLSINSDAQLGAATNAILFETGTLRITGSTPSSTNRSITLLPSGVSGSKIDVQNTDTATGFTIASAITGAGPLIKKGPGILTLSGANTFGLSTIVEAGTLQVTGPNVLSPSSTVGVFAGATVKLNGFSQQVARIMDGSHTSFGTIDLGTNPGTVLTVGQNGVFKSPISFNGQIVGQGHLVYTGLGSQWIGGTSFYLGTTTVRQGNLELLAPVPASGSGPLGDAAGGAIRLGDANFAGLDAAITSTDKSSSGFARAITVVAGDGKRTIGHRLFGSTHANGTVTFSGAIDLEKDLHLYSIDDLATGSAALRFNGPIGGTGGLVKIGGAEVIIRSDNTYTGATTINNGRFELGGAGVQGSAALSSGFLVRTNWSDFGIALDTQHSPAPTDRNLAELLIHDFAPNPNRIGDVDVTLAQATLNYLGQNAGASTESFRNLIIERSANTLMLETPLSVNVTSATLSLTGGFDRQNRGTLRVISPLLGNSEVGDFTRILAASPPALVGGGGAEGSTNMGIVPWAYHDTDPNVRNATSVESFLTYAATGLRPLANNEYVDSLTAAGTLNNVRITAASTTLSQNQTINALRYGLTANGTITLTGQTLTINSGAILSTSDLLTFDGGEIAFGAAEGIVHSTDFSSITINSVVSGSAGLTSHLGFGSTLALNGVNTYTGPTTINSGHVSFNNAASFGAGLDPIRLRWGWQPNQGSTMTYTAAGATTLTKPIELGPSTNSLRLSSTGTLTLTGVISGTSLDPVNDVLTFSSFTGAGAFELRAANTFTGNVGLLSGTLSIVADNNLGPTTNRLTLGSGTASTATLRFDAAGIEVARPITLGGHAVLRTTGQNAVISGPMSGGTSTFTLTKTGAGTLTLTGTHTTGAVIQIAAGTLHVNGTLSPAGGGGSGGPPTVMVHVNNGAALGGSGTVHRRVQVNTNGFLEPGAGVGTLTLGALQFASGATANYLWEAGATAQDQIVVTSGPVNLTGITVNLGLLDRGLGTNVAPDMQFPLLTVAGANSITGFSPATFNVFFTDTPNWTTGQYSLNVVQLGGNSVLVLSNISPVPEPASVLSVAAVALVLAARRRRRLL